MKRTSFIILCFFCGFFLSCTQKVSPLEYLKFISDKSNGFVQEINRSGWTYVIQYKPHDLIVFQEHSVHEITQRLEQLKGTIWFNVSLKRADNVATPLRYATSSLEEYNSRLDYFLNSASQDFKLLYGEDTLGVMSYLFENNYNLTPQETMVVGFALTDGNDLPEKDMQLVYTDRVFHNGSIVAKFSAKKISRAPKPMLQ